MLKEYDAVVIGAGVAGSSMAYALARQGWSVALADKDKFPRHKACGEFLSPESLETLKRLGLDADVRSLRPASVMAVRLHSEKGVSLEIPLPGPAVGLSRYALDARLQSAARSHGVHMYAGFAFSGVTDSAEGYVVRFASKDGLETFRSRSLFAAWGRRSMNGIHGTRPRPDRSDFVGIKSHIAGCDPEPVVDLYFFEGGYIGFSPVEEERTNAAALMSGSVLRGFNGSDAIPSLMEQAAERIPALKKRLKQATVIPGTHAAAFPVRTRPHPNAWDGLPHLGDAVGVIPPFCGDGMSMALRSVELCAPLANAYLLGASTRAEWKKAYTRQIKQQFTGSLRWGRLLELLLTRPWLCSSMLRMGSVMPVIAETMIRATRLRG